MVLALCCAVCLLCRNVKAKYNFREHWRTLAPNSIQSFGAVSLTHSLSPQNPIELNDDLMGIYIYHQIIQHFHRCYPFIFAPRSLETCAFTAASLSLSRSRRVTEIDGLTSMDTQHIHHKLNAWWLFLFDFDADFLFHSFSFQQQQKKLK